MTALQVNVLARDDAGNVVSDTVTVDVADAPAPAPADMPGSQLFPGIDASASSTPDQPGPTPPPEP